MNRHDLLLYPLLTRLFLTLVICVSLANLCSWIMKDSPYHTLMRQAFLGMGLLLAGLVVLLWQIRKTTMLVAPLLKAALAEFPFALQQAVSELGLESRVTLIAHQQPIAFCWGFWQPRICISTGLLDLLSPAELKAVLLHEDEHCRNRDPLRILLVEAVSSTFFFLPVIREWAAVYKIGLELRADEYAVGRVGKKALASALHRLFTQPVSSTKLSQVAVAGLSANQARIAALLGERNPLPVLSLRNLLFSSLILWGICLLLMV